MVLTGGSSLLSVTHNLIGKRILVTRPREQAADLITRLESLGAEVLAMPAIRIEAMDPAPLRAALAHHDRYQWLIFTSRNAVQIVFDELDHLGLGADVLHGIRVVAVGPKTAEALKEHGIQVAVTPERYVAEGVLDALSRRSDVRGARFLYAAAEAARDALPSGLRDMGAEVDVVHIYRAASGSGSDEAREVRARLERGTIDLVTFASGSAVRAFVDAVGMEAARLAPAASIGPVTSEAARASGLTVLVEAQEHTIEGLVSAIAGALG